MEQASSRSLSRVFRIGAFDLFHINIVPSSTPTHVGFSLLVFIIAA